MNHIMPGKYANPRLPPWQGEGQLRGVAARWAGTRLFGVTARNGQYSVNGIPFRAVQHTGYPIRGRPALNSRVRPRRQEINTDQALDAIFLSLSQAHVVPSLQILAFCLN
jgi:hypothetical protein